MHAKLDDLPSILDIKDCNSVEVFWITILQPAIWIGLHVLEKEILKLNEISKYYLEGFPNTSHDCCNLLQVGEGF